MIDTPRTDAALKASRDQFDALQKLTAEAVKLERENAALLATLMKCRFYVTNWEAYDDDSAYKRLEMLRKMDAFIEPARKEQP